MRLQTFRAGSMHEALAQVKRRIGPRAVIVRTRTFKNGGVLGIGARTVVEVTAREDQEPSVGQRRPVNDRLRRVYESGRARRQAPISGDTPSVEGGRVQASVDAGVELSEDIKGQMVDLRRLVEGLVKEQRQLHAPQMPEQLFDMYLDLIQREVAEEVARELIHNLQARMGGNEISNANLVRAKLAELIDPLIETAGPIARNLNGSARVVALVGPTGVGKTTTIAKLAANFKLRQEKQVGLITVDTYRIGAVDQLRTYAEIIDVPLKVVLTPSELAAAVASMRHLDVVLIDTAGRSQNDKIKIHELQRFLAAAQADEVHLVLSSTAHQSHLMSAAERFKEVGVDRVIFTKLDEAVSFGVVLSVTQRLQASLSYVTTGQDVPDDIEVGSGRRLSRLLLGLEHLSGQPGLAVDTAVG